MAANVVSLLQESTPIVAVANKAYDTPTQAPKVLTTSSTSFGSGGAQTTVSTSNTTDNWAGYVSTGGTYTGITGSWIVPSVSATSDSTAADATWIGIGGDTSSDLIQVGTQDMMSAGQQTTGTFYERLPDTAVSIPTVSVNAGDTINASITEVSTGEWKISITDVTNGQSFTNSVAYNSSESSAEWIQEAPS